MMFCVCNTGTIHAGRLLSAIYYQVWPVLVESRGLRVECQVLLGWTRAIPYVALKTANMQAGVAAGMAQGELQGCFNNLQTVMRIIAPLLWSGLYSLGSSKGRPGVFHYGVSAACFVQLILSMLVIRNFQYHGVYQRFWVYFE